MKLKNEQQTRVDKVANVVYAYFNVTEQNILDRDTRDCISIARYFLWYILHYELNLSSATIAAIYERHPRNIKYGCAKIRIEIENRKGYRLMYDELMEKIGTVLLDLEA